ncbi:MAG: ELM1/GtrOC1 family putative glycosyltransferase [Nitrospirales bacterium]
MSRHRSRPKGIRAIPEKIVLEVREGITSSGKSPVRIFIGSEAAQYRAERILVWSIEQVRDPGRVYEIFLMKELSGFDRSRWLTGFTNYRFAIPELAGSCGRAIYNDVDQVYLTDPGELFDHNLQEHGFLTIAPNDTSVMVMDCRKMAAVWSLEAAKFERKNAQIQRALDTPNLWGKLEAEWNARDEEYQPGHSKILHYTALHTQPWHPFPNQFVYQHSPEGDVWVTLEEQANRTGYQLFNRARPSLRFKELMTHTEIRKTVLPAGPPPFRDVHDLSNLDEHLATREMKTCLWCHLGQVDDRPDNGQKFSGQKPLVITPYDLCRQPPDSMPAQKYDIVYSADELQHIPDEDIPWILEEMFSLANSLVFVRIQAEEPGNIIARNPHSCGVQRNFEWWVSHFHIISRHYPKIHWKFVFSERGARGINQQLVRCGGHWMGHPPRIWILSDGKVGHTTQSEALARLLGWPYEIKHLRFHWWNRLQKVLWGLLPPHTVGLDTGRSSPLNPPWPDIVLNAGWRSVPVARWIRQQNQGQTRIVQLGRKAGFSIDLFDVAITPTYYGFPPHPRRIETATPLNQLTQQSIDEVSRQWPNLFQNTPHPRIALILGGSTTVFSFTPDMATRLAKQAKDLAKQCGGTIFAVTSPRTGEPIAQAFESILQPEHSLHRWKRDQTANPYLAFLAGADIILVTGDSESMLAETASLGKPVYIISLPQKPQTWIIQLNDWIIQRAHARRLNKRGTVRPQQGLERLCARLMRGGLVQPRRDLTILHETLIQKGIASRFGEPLQNGTRPQLHENEAIARRVKEKLGIFDPS